MTIERGSDLVLKIKDDRGNGIRVSNKASFYIRVFTADKNQYLEYHKNDIIERNDYDTVHLSSDALATLDSGVIAYTYGWGISDDNFNDGEYNKVKTVYTNYYFQNDEVVPSISAGDVQILREKIESLTEKVEAHTVTVEGNTLIITT